jgi:hypothetical protein
MTRERNCDNKGMYDLMQWTESDELEFGKGFYIARHITDNLLHFERIKKIVKLGLNINIEI